MGIADEIEGKPGGAALAGHVRKLEKARPGEITAIAQRWRTAGQDSDNSGNGVDGSVKGLDGAWQGASADAFVGYMGKVTQGFGKATGALDSAATAMDNAAEVVMTGKEALGTIGERALADARKAEQECARAIKGHEDDEDLVREAERARDAKIEQAMTQHAAEAESKVDQASQQLADLVGKVEASNGELGGAFSPIPLAGDQPFTPGEGKKTQWDFQSPGAPAQTAPASAESSTASGSGSGGSSGSGSGSGGSGSGGASGSGGSDGGSGGSGGAGGASGGLGSSGGPPTSGPPPGNVDQWIREAIKILQQNGVPVTEDNIDEIWTIIEKESGGDPHAINNWDSNAAKGTPSKGLMQCIDPTFDAHKLPGHGDIYNPVDNIIAGVRYTFDRYGGFEGHPGLESMAGGGGYQGY